MTGKLLVVRSTYIGIHVVWRDIHSLAGFQPMVGQTSTKINSNQKMKIRGFAKFQRDTSSFIHS